MKKLLLLLLTFTILIGCAKDDEFLEPITNEEVPQSLQIKELIGIKLFYIIIKRFTITLTTKMLICN